MDNTEIDIYFQGKRLNFNNPILFEKNRFYIPVFEGIKKVRGRLDLKDHIIISSLSKLHGVKGSCFFNGIYLESNEIYVSFFIFTYALNLKIRWDYNGNKIYIYINKDKWRVQENFKTPSAAYIRLEDFTAGATFDSGEALEKVRIISDMLYARAIPFHVAWIPRYLNPKNEIDNDISKDFSFYNSDFLFTLEYIISRGGVIGLHGYTHQLLDEESGEGSEFGEERLESETSTRERIEAAIEIAETLDIPYKFFESPHYSITREQQKIAEEYFDFIYHPYVGVWNEEPIISPLNNKTIYVPTPLDYVKDNSDEVIKKIENLKFDDFASFFYHPSKEFEFIKLKRDRRGYPEFIYSAESYLNKIINCFFEKDYHFKKITNINIKK